MAERYKLYKFPDADNVFEDKINGDAWGFDEYYQPFIVDLLNGKETAIELLKGQLNEMIDLFNERGLDYHISDELEEILEEDD